VVAIRPGFVVTDEMRVAYKDMDEEQLRQNPGAIAVREAIESGRGDSPDGVAEAIWSLLPPEPDGRTVLFLGEFIEGSQG
jgi:hypothetical protein